MTQAGQTQSDTPMPRIPRAWIVRFVVLTLIAGAVGWSALKPSDPTNMTTCVRFDPLQKALADATIGDGLVAADETVTLSRTTSRTRSFIQFPVDQGHRSIAFRTSADISRVGIVVGGKASDTEPYVVIRDAPLFGAVGVMKITGSRVETLMAVSGQIDPDKGVFSITRTESALELYVDCRHVGRVALATDPLLTEAPQLGIEFQPGAVINAAKAW